jgi:ribosome-associated translation inhibitor RaiA
MQVGNLKLVTGESVNEDCYLAFDDALDKVAKQLRRKKRELRDDKPVRLKDSALIAGMRAPF